MVKAWDEIDAAIIIKAFKRCCISNALDGSEDDALYEEDSDSKDDTDPLADIDNADEDSPYDDIQL